MSTQHIESFHIVGISIRTTNQNGHSAKDIPLLWQQFMEQQIAHKIPSKLSDDLYCLYTDYESDHTGLYTTLLGCRVVNLEEIPEGMKGMTFSGGHYKTFQVRGDLTSGIIYQQWMDIWKIELDRTFIVDFEVYGDKATNPLDAEVDIFVGVR